MRLRVLMIVSYFHPVLGGSEQQALHLAAGLIKRGVHVSVLTRRIKGLPRFEQVMDIPVYRSIRTIQFNKLFGITYILSVFWFLYRKRNSYDIIHCHIAQGFHSIVALLIKSLFKKKVIIKVAATGPISDFTMIKKVVFGDTFLNKLKSADRIITICSQSRQEALGQGIPASSIIHIPNGVDIDYFKPLSSGEDKENKVIFIGRLDAMKGVHVLLKAFKQLRDEGLQACLNIIGDGPDRDKYESMARDMDLNNSVNFSGEIKEVVSFLRKSTMFVLPSLSEGLSNVLLESMACALPVVATRVGGNTDLIQDGMNGILVDSENPGQLSEAMMNILKDKILAKQLGAAARKTVERNYSINHIIDKYVKLYKQLLS